MSFFGQGMNFGLMGGVGGGASAYPASLVARYDIGLEPVLANEAEMPGVSDQSGNGYDISFPRDQGLTEPLYADGNSYPNEVGWFHTIRQPGAISSLSTPLQIVGLVKPITILIVFEKGDWGVHGPMIDGYTPFTMCIQEEKGGASGGHYELVGSGVSANDGVGSMYLADYPSGHWGKFLFTAVFNGASSYIQCGQQTPVSGLNTGSGEPGGITLGMYGDQSDYASKNFFQEIQIYAGLPDVVPLQTALIAKWTTQS